MKKLLIVLFLLLTSCGFRVQFHAHNHKPKKPVRRELDLRLDRDSDTKTGLEPYYNRLRARSLSNFELINLQSRQQHNNWIRYYNNTWWGSDVWPRPTIIDLVPRPNPFISSIQVSAPSLTAGITINLKTPQK